MDFGTKVILLTLVATSSVVGIIASDPAPFRAMTLPPPTLDGWLRFLIGPGWFLWIAFAAIPFVLWYIRQATKSREVAVPMAKTNPLPSVKEYAKPDVEEVPYETTEEEKEREEAWAKQPPFKMYAGPPRQDMGAKANLPARQDDFDFERYMAEKIISDSRWRLAPSSRMSMVKDPETKKMKMELTKIDFEIAAQDIKPEKDVGPEPEKVAPKIPDPPKEDE